MRCLLIAACLLTSTSPRFAHAVEERGAVEGTVRYQNDPGRPWRLGRYYIRDSRKGYLAEAVVALRSRDLRQAQRDQDAVTHAMDQKDFQFVPETLAIRAGDRVKFTNSDNAVHNVRCTDSLASFSVNTPIGGGYTHRFERGEGILRPIQLGCAFHGSMRAWIFVFPHPFFEVTDEDGQFRLVDVPAGNYYLEMRHPAGELKWRGRIEVTPGNTTRVDMRVSPDDKQGGG